MNAPPYVPPLPNIEYRIKTARMMVTREPLKQGCLIDELYGKPGGLPSPTA